MAPEYCHIISEAQKLVYQERMQFKEKYNETYSLEFDIIITNLGADLLKLEEKRSRRNPVIRFFKGKSILNDNALTQNSYKYLDKLSRIAHNLEQSAKECNRCKELKREMAQFLDQFDQRRTEKKDGLIAYSRVIRKNKDFFKEYRRHFKHDHHRVDLERIENRVLEPIAIVLLLVSYSVFTIMSNSLSKINGVNKIVLFIALPGLLGTFYLLDKIRHRIVFWLKKNKETF